MNSAIDRKTELREARALIKARFSMADAAEMTAAQDRHSGVCYCPNCRSENLEGAFWHGERFFCPDCSAAGDAVTFVQIARGGISTAAAIDAIEAWMESRS